MSLSCSAGFIRGDGRYRLRPDGSYETTDGTGLGAGTYDVTIGGKTFRCLRVLESDLAEPEGGELTEAYVERGGRTVFHRRYDGRFYRGGDLLRQYPDHPRKNTKHRRVSSSWCRER